MVHMHLTVPHQRQDPALSSWAQRRISLPIATDPSRSLPWAKRMGSEPALERSEGVTLCDCSNGQVQFVQIEPCLKFQHRDEKVSSRKGPPCKIAGYSSGDAPRPLCS